MEEFEVEVIEDLLKTGYARLSVIKGTDIRHSINDEPAAICYNLTFAWYNKGKLHRENGPAFDYPSWGYSEWWYNGKRHRLDGPAVIDEGEEQYWINDIQYSKEKFNILKSWFKLKET